MERDTTYTTNEYRIFGWPVKGHGSANGFYFNRISHRGPGAVRFDISSVLRSQTCRFVRQTNRFHLSLNTRMEESVLCLSVAINN